MHLTHWHQGKTNLSVSDREKEWPCVSFSVLSAFISGWLTQGDRHGCGACYAGFCLLSSRMRHRSSTASFSTRRLNVNDDKLHNDWWKRWSRIAPCIQRKNKSPKELALRHKWIVCKILKENKSNYNAHVMSMEDTLYHPFFYKYFSLWPTEQGCPIHTSMI